MKKSSLILMAILIAACAKQSLQTTYDKQASYIEKFISSQMNSDTTATLTEKSGAYRLTLHDTLDVSRDSLLKGGRAIMYYACFTLTSSSLSSSNLVATNIKDLATQAGWALTDSTRYKADTLTLDSRLVPGLECGLDGVQALDEGYILFTGKYGYGGKEKGTIPARSALAYYFYIIDVKNED